MSTADLNANVGESFGIWSRGDDSPVWGRVTTVNVACGFHAGDPATMRRCAERAVEHRARLCGLIGYRDLAGFGNRFLDVAAADLRAEAVYQLGALDGIALAAGANLGAVRLAGALGRAVGTNRTQADAVAGAIGDYDPKLVVITSSAPFAEVARAAGLTVEVEADATAGVPAAVAAARAGRAQTVHVDPATAAAVAKELPR